MSSVDQSTVSAKRLELLASPLFTHIGPSTHDDEETERWWADHRPLVAAWLRDKLNQTEDAFELEQMRFAATALISTPDVRGWGCAPGMPEREPLCWDELDAYEVLFEHLAMGSLCEGWSATLVGASVAEFAAYLGHRGILEKGHAQALAEEFETWVPNFVDYFERGRWYNRPRGHLASFGDA